MHDQPRQQRLDLYPPLATVPTAASVVVAHQIGPLAFDPGMLLPYERRAGRRGPGPRGVILGLISVLDDTPPLLLGPCRQAPRVLGTPRTLALGKDTRPAGVVGTALRGRRLWPAGTGHHAPLGIQDTRLGAEPGRLGPAGGGT